LFELVGLFFIKLDAFAAPRYFVLFTAGIMLAIFGAVVWFYWQGRNWARWIIMLLAILPSLIILVRGYTIRPLAIEILDDSFGLFMLYWLNTERIRTFFRTAPRIRTSS
jgi:hypothetical protein